MKPEYIIIHCSDSTWGSAKEIDKWHKQRGWVGIGYHFVILNGMVRPHSDRILSLAGSVELGRGMDVIGAHCLGYNERSLGICLIGDGNESFCVEQFDKLKGLCQELCKLFEIPAENVLGHGETDSGKAEGKTCPNFDVSAIRMYLKGRV